MSFPRPRTGARFLLGAAAWGLAGILALAAPGAAGADPAAVPVSGAAATAPTASVQAPQVVLDPGHGGDDPGVIEPGFREADFTLALAQRMVPLLKARGITAALTRDGDQALSVSARVALADAWRPRAFVSLHVNAAFQPLAAGPRVFIPVPAPALDPAAPLWQQASGLQEAASRALGTSLARALGLHGAHAVQTLKLAVFRGLAVPGCLVELEFATHPEGLARLTDGAFADDLAAHLTAGIAEYLRGRPAAPAGSAHAPR